MTTQERNNRTDQLNPNNHAYWQSRGYTGRPADWHEQIAAKEALPDR